jgi:hypothetical protein
MLTCYGCQPPTSLSIDWWVPFWLRFPLEAFTENANLNEKRELGQPALFRSVAMWEGLERKRGRMSERAGFGIVLGAYL